MNGALPRFIAVLVLAGAALLAAPAARALREQVPPRPPSQRIGVGPLLGSVLTGSFRPLLLTYLWMRTDTLYGNARHDELYRTFQTMLALYPDNEQAREFLGWHLAFNLKSENDARRRELAWRWASEGLDALRGTRSGRETLAFWFLAQCGQNARHPDAPLRYFGPGWEDERWWRARAGEWTRRHTGEALSRFEAGRWALAGRADFLGRAVRALLLERIVYEEWILDGESGRFDEADTAMRAWVRDNVEHPAFARVLQDGVSLMRLLQKRDRSAIRALQRRLDRKEHFPYRAALAAISLGAREKKRALVEVGARAMARLDQELNPKLDLFAEERALGQAWLRYLPWLRRGETPPGLEPPLPKR